MKIRNEKKAEREIWFNNVRLVGHGEVKANMRYTVTGPNYKTWVTQPVRFSFCTMRELCGDLHVVLEKLQAQLDDARDTMSGGPP